MIEPNSPDKLIQCIRNGDIADFMKIYKNLDDKLLFKYIGHQIEADDQVHQIENLPEDEMLLQILYDMDDSS